MEPIQTLQNAETVPIKQKNQSWQGLGPWGQGPLGLSSRVCQDWFFWFYWYSFSILQHLDRFYWFYWYSYTKSACVTCLSLILRNMLTVAAYS